MTATTPKLTLRDFFSFTIITLVYAMFPLLIVGRWDWWPGWAYAALMILSTLLSRVIAFRKNPGILAERARSLDNKDAKEWDKKLVPFAAMLGPLAILITSGLDARFGWTPSLSVVEGSVVEGLPGWVPLAGLILLILALALGDWAFVENKFFSGTVRIQTDRGHYVIETGPYRSVRHPGYVSATWSYLAIPLLFGSLWGLIPGLFTAALFILRTALEDKTLQEELPGYKEYTQKTKYRLWPGVW